jgi:hypothetical protein
VSSIEEALIARRVTDSGVIALAGTRVFPGARVAGPEMPAVVLNRIRGGPEYADDGEVGVEQAPTPRASPGL